ncbi:MAG TPA: ARMT1-like domain-containing protein [Acidobacteriota bacterium]|nr:ARMT1-like domain-containing protein [Acidobacteriota bacterium]
MNTALECWPCLIRQSWEAVCLATKIPSKRDTIMRQALRRVSEMDLRMPPPVMAGDIHAIIRQETGCRDPYRAFKDKYTRLAMELFPELRRRVAVSADPFETAVRLAIAGNIIDAGALPNLNEDGVLGAIDEALAAPIAGDAVRALHVAATQAEHILYLADNAGEIVFDRILIELLGPEKTTMAVRSDPILNDATYEDAAAAGLPGVVTVMTSGSDLPGTVLEEASWDFRRLFDRADLVIAKGQGNYETLADVNRSVFFVLRAKCPVIAAHIGCAVGAWVIHHSVVGRREEHVGRE